MGDECMFQLIDYKGYYRQTETDGDLCAADSLSATYNSYPIGINRKIIIFRFGLYQ